jgi:hypothetical protein
MVTADDGIPGRGSLYGADLAVRLEAIKPMVAEGWTAEGAMDHIEGSCDRLICCGWEDNRVIPWTTIHVDGASFAVKRLHR